MDYLNFAPSLELYTIVKQTHSQAGEKPDFSGTWKKIEGWEAEMV